MGPPLAPGPWACENGGVDQPPIELEREPFAPKLEDSVQLAPTPEEATAALASDVALQAMACVRRFGCFHLALSGGGPVERLLRELMIDPAYRALPWARTHVWILEERPVPHADPASVFGMVRDLLVGHSGIAREQVHEVAPFRPAAHDEYERAIQRQLAERPGGHDRLDCAVLAMARSGAVGRLGEVPQRDAGRLVVRLPDGDVVATPRLLASSRFLAIVALGAPLREPLSRIAGGEGAPLPRLLGGHTRWYIDRDACPDVDGAGP